MVGQEARGYAPSHKRVRETAALMPKLSGDVPLGKRWVQNFLKRNSRVATLLGKPVESSRIRGTQPDQINLFYQNFNFIRSRKNVQQDDVWNMDQRHRLQQLSGAWSRRKTQNLHPIARESGVVSIPECIGATDQLIRPLVIFKVEGVQTSCFTEDNIPDWLISASSRGL